MKELLVKVSTQRREGAKTQRKEVRAKNAKEAKVAKVAKGNGTLKTRGAESAED
jgi:hypothetical protein